jgi:hypothetical protein
MGSTSRIYLNERKGLLRQLRNILILMVFIIPVLAGCGGGGGGGGSGTPPDATFDNATFDESTWK